MRVAGGTTPRPGLILAATVTAAMLVVANVSSLNVALPELSRELDASQADVQWMVDIYAVFLAALLLPAGALGDRFGRRGMLLFGLIILAVGNAATLAVDTAGPVIALRAVSGVGAAFVFPATLSTITATLPDEQRGRGVAMWTAAVGIGGILGVLASGALIESYWWGSVFLAMAIASVAVLTICWAFVPDSSDPEESNLDPVGAVLSFLGVGGLVLGVIEGPVEGWTSALSLGGLLVGSVAMVAFVAWEWRNPLPLLDVRLFRERGVRSGSLSIFVQFTAAFGFFFLTVPYLAFVRGFGPLDTGLGLLPVAIGLFPGSAIAIPLTRRYGRRLMGVVGLTILGSAFVVGTILDGDSSFTLFALVMALFGLGLGLSSPPATEAIVEALPAAQQGVASALNDVLREFGAAIGIAAVGSAFNAGYRATVDDEVIGFPDEIIEAVRETPAAAAVIAPDLGADGGPTLLAAVSEAVIDGWVQGMWLTAAIVAVGLVGYAIWAPRRAVGTSFKRPDHPSPGATGSAAQASIDLRDIEHRGPTGVGAAAGIGLEQLASTYADLIASIALFDARSRLPDDMDSWPREEQAAVCERAGRAMAGPLRELTDRCEAAANGTGACDRLHADARHELEHSGSPERLHQLALRAHAAMTSAYEADTALMALADRFELMAAAQPGLGAASARLRAASDTVDRAYRMSLSWVDTTDAPRRASAAAHTDA